MRQRPVLSVVGAFALVATFLAACSSPVAVEATPGHAACARFLEDLPDSVGDQERREVEGGPGAAYGDPPIVIRCGVPRPEELMTNCQTIEGVDWYVAERDTAAVATTVGREPGIEVAVPVELGPSAAALVDIADAVDEHTVSHAPCAA